MSLLWNVVFFFSAVVFLAYCFYKRRYGYWKSRGVEGPEPRPIVGNLGRLSLGVLFHGLYERYEHLPFFGFYMVHRPFLMVNDLDVIRSVFIRDFDHFTDRPIAFDRRRQPITDNLFTAGGLRWKSIRTHLTPAFTSNKMKYMFELMLTCGEDLRRHLDEQRGVELDVKETSAKFTTDAIGSCAFGLEANCFKYPDAQLRVIGRRMASFSFRRTLTIITQICAPGLQKVINGRFIEDEIADFFIETVRATIRHREENNIERSDLLQLLIKLKNKQSIEDEGSSKALKEHDVLDVAFDEIEVAAQCFSFFFAGFEATSTTLTVALYELARHESVQRKAYEEMQRVLAKYDGKVTYEGINEMTYLTQVVEETLRLHSTAPQLLRTCVKDYTIPNTNVTIEKGTPVVVSTQGIHLNPKYYDNPKEFNPENFSAESKARRDPMAFLTFGEGPRTCIGNRFAILQIKIALVYILRSFHVKEPADKSSNKISNNAIFLAPEVTLKFEKRL